MTERDQVDLLVIGVNGTEPKYLQSTMPKHRDKAYTSLFHSASMHLG
jgi:hypothetical protein